MSSRRGRRRREGNRVEDVEDVKEVMRLVSKPLKSIRCEDDDAAAAPRRLCSRSVVDEMLDVVVDVLHVRESLGCSWASSAARRSRLGSMVVVNVHEK